MSWEKVQVRFGDTPFEAFDVGVRQEMDGISESGPQRRGQPDDFISSFHQPNFQIMKMQTWGHYHHHHPINPSMENLDRGK